jgi:hypothetical protein
MYGHKKSHLTNLIEGDSSKQINTKTIFDFTILSLRNKFTDKDDLDFFISRPT